LYLVLGTLVRPLLALVLRGTGGSVLVVAVLHSVFNRTNNENGIVARLLDGQARQITMLLAVVILAAVTAIAIRQKPSRSTRGHRTPRRRRFSVAHPPVLRRPT
jgi:hypothetical protein